MRALQMRSPLSTSNNTVVLGARRALPDGDDGRLGEAEREGFDEVESTRVPFLGVWRLG
jgi:hypothetical protein